MGICIAYMGKLRDPADIPALVLDLQTRAAEVGWPCKTMAELLAERVVTCAGLEGITLYPHRACEPLRLHFDRDGTFVNHWYYELLHDPEKAAMIREMLAESAALTRTLRARARPDDGDDGDAGDAGDRAAMHAEVVVVPPPSDDTLQGGLHYNWTKTQHAGAQVHIAVCAVLRYVQQRYAPDLTVTDDSGFFVDGDRHKLETQLAHIDYLVSVTSQAATAAAASGSAMTIDTFIARLQAELATADQKLH